MWCRDEEAFKAGARGLGSEMYVSGNRVRQLEIHVRVNGGKQQQLQWWANIQMLTYDNTEGTHCHKLINNNVIVDCNVSLLTSSYAYSADIAQPFLVLHKNVWVQQVFLNIVSELKNTLYTVILTADFPKKDYLNFLEAFVSESNY